MMDLQNFHIKVNGYLFRGSNFVSFVASLFRVNSSFLCCPRSKFFNPIALRKAKIVYNFGLYECNRVKSFRNFRNVSSTIEALGKSQNLFLTINMAEKYSRYTIFLRL